MLPAVVFHGVIVVSLSCTAYHWGTFIEAELVRVDTYQGREVTLKVLPKTKRKIYFSERRQHLYV